MLIIGFKYLYTIEVSKRTKNIHYLQDNGADKTNPGGFMAPQISSHPTVLHTHLAPTI